MFNQRKIHRDIFSSPARHDDEEIVQNGLAVTPAQMLEMTEHNIPISASNAGLEFEEGVGKLDFEPPIDFRRGVDMGDIWETSMDINAKFKKGFVEASKAAAAQQTN